MVERGRLPKLTSLRGQISFEYYFISNCSKARLKRDFFPSKGDRAKYYAKSLWLFVIKILHTISTFHSVEKRKIHSHQKIFRQINTLVIYHITLLSRNFCQKSARVNFRNFHTVFIVPFREGSFLWSCSLHVLLRKFLLTMRTNRQLTPLRGYTLLRPLV